MSQVTKPIALDKTLQDVVTAIQGITHGGMIVFTGNVGSATQPVYINGGVPTAISSTFTLNSQADSTIETLVNLLIADVITKSYGVYGYAGSWNSHSDGYMATVTYGAGSVGGTDYEKVAGTVYEYANGRVWTFIAYYTPSTQTWSTVKISQIYGITTGTPTLNSTYVSGGNIAYQKSGNVVCVSWKWIAFSTALPDGGLIASNLPKPKARQDFMCSTGTSSMKELVITVDGNLNTTGGGIATSITLYPHTITYLTSD